MKGDRLLEALEEAMAARVIAELPRATDQYWFSHALIRETLYEELSTTRRVRLHRQIGEALEELDAEGNLPQLAYHFAEAAPGGDVEKAVDYAERAAERAIEPGGLRRGRRALRARAAGARVGNAGGRKAAMRTIARAG